MNIVYEYSESVADGVAYYYGLNRTHNSEGEIYLYNAHGDVVQLVKDNAVVVSYTYDAFGNLTSQIGESGNPFLYCGEYYDAETQTYYLRARYYNPANGRFTQQDAWAFMDASDPLSLNLYAYCCNNPVMYVDPSGNDAVQVRKTIESLGGSVFWNSRTQRATILLDGQTIELYHGDKFGSSINNSTMYIDDKMLFALLAKNIDLGKGWNARIERGTSGKEYQRHIHIYNSEKKFSQNEDGSPHDGNHGDPPKSVQKELKKIGWDWKKKQNDWLNKILITSDGMGAEYIMYPNGRFVTVYKDTSFLYDFSVSVSRQQLKDYYFGPVEVDLRSTSVSSSAIYFTPIPGPVQIPVPGISPFFGSSNMK